MLLATSDQNYFTEYQTYQDELIVPWWGGVETLGVISLLDHGRDLLSEADFQSLVSRFTSLANGLLGVQQSSAYRVAMTASDFSWGSNSAVLNQALIFIQAGRISGDEQFWDAAAAQLDYVLGRNATGFSFVTGFGDKTPMNPHHRPSEADGIQEPVPGFVVGGPHAGKQDEAYCDFYTSSLPAVSYIDEWCSYATNEVTINWNAPLVYVTAALSSKTD